MPRPGWRSITVSEEVYEMFYQEWIKNRDYYLKEYGITSFTGFCTKVLVFRGGCFKCPDPRRVEPSRKKVRYAKYNT